MNFPDDQDPVPTRTYGKSGSAVKYKWIAFRGWIASCGAVRQVSAGATVLQKGEKKDVVITFMPKDIATYSEIIPFEINGLYTVPVTVASPPPLTRAPEGLPLESSRGHVGLLSPMRGRNGSGSGSIPPK